MSYDFKLEAMPDVEYCLDYSRILKKYDRPDAIFYLDPPYVGKEDWYKCEFSHEELFDNFKEIKFAKVFLSYERNDKILDLYKDYKMYGYEGKRQNFRNEILIVK